MSRDISQNGIFTTNIAVFVSDFQIVEAIEYYEPETPAIRETYSENATGGVIINSTRYRYSNETIANLNRAIDMMNNGMSLRQAARTCGMDKSKLCRLLQKIRSPETPRT